MKTTSTTTTVISTGTVVLLLLCTACSLPLAAQFPGDTLTPQRAVAFAREHHPAVGRLLGRLRAREAEYIGGAGIAMPELTYTREGIPDNGTGFAEQRLTVVQRLDFPLRTLYRLDRIELERRAIDADLRAELRRLRSRIHAAYVDALYARELLALRLRDRELLREISSTVRTLSDVGEGNRIDVLSAELRLAEAETAAAEAQQQFTAARTALLYETGLPFSPAYERLILPDSLVYRSLPLVRDSLARLYNSQPAMTAADTRVAAAGAAVREGIASWFPSLSGGYYRHDYGAGYHSYGFEIGLTLPLWFLSEQRGAVRKAEAEEVIARNDRNQTALDLQRRISDAWNGLETAQAALQRFGTTLGAQADTLLALALDAYRAGDVGLIVLLDAQRAHLASRIQYANALHTYYLRSVELEEFFDNNIVFTSP